MARLSDRVKALEQGRAYPEAVIQQALQLLTTEELEHCIAKMESVIDGGEPLSTAAGVTRRITELCEYVERSTSGRTT